MMLKVLRASRFIRSKLTPKDAQRSIRQFVTIPVAANVKFLPKASLDKFENFYEDVANDIINNELVTALPKVNDILKTVLDYNVPTGRKIRSSLLIASYQLLTNEENISMEDMRNVYILGWSYEMMIAAYIIQDDIVDNSCQRRGQPTWHKCVGMKAINDSIVVEAASDKLLEKYFSNHKNYHNMLKLFRAILRISRVGQLLETSTTTLDEYTTQRYNEIAYHKMGHCTFDAPITLAALFACKEHLLASKEVTEIFKELGYLYTIMNDYMDCYGEEYFRKLGTDIQEKRCTWLIITALQKANGEQRRILEECYGSYEEEKLHKVKQIYNELKIHETYEVTEKNIYDKIKGLLKDVRDKEARHLLNEIVKIVFRKKINN